MIPLPEQFENRMRTMLGEEEYAAFLASYDGPLHTGLRLNPLKLPENTGKAAEHLAAFHLRPVPWAQPYGFCFGTETARPGKSPLHEAGLFYIQEPSAMAAAALSRTEPGEKILDLCAAPGGKSTQLAGMLEGKGLLVSNEINPGRAKILSQNIERMGVRNAVVTCEDSGKLAEWFGAFFDRVIVDAPCSGEGMFRKEPQALAMWSPANVKSCAARQSEILDNAAVMLKSGGTLVYSTCTFAPEEDEENVAAFLTRHPGFSPAELTDVPEKTEPGSCLSEMRRWGFVPGSVPGTIRLWPHRVEGEGHFIAILQKSGERVEEKIPAGNGFAAGESAAAADRKKAGAAGRRGTGLSAQMMPALGGFLQETIRMEIGEQLARDAGSSLVRFGNDLCLLPYASQVTLGGLSVLRPGLVIGSMKKDRFEPSHSLAMALRPAEVNMAWNLDADSREASAWLHGESLPCDASCRGWTLVTIDGVSAGWGKASGGMMKNHYPKGLRRPYV